MHVIRRIDHIPQGDGVIIIARRGIDRQPADAVKIYLGPCVSVLPGERGVAACNPFCGGVIALHVARGDTVRTQRLHGGRGILHRVAAVTFR